MIGYKEWFYTFFLNFHSHIYLSILQKDFAVAVSRIERGGGVGVGVEESPQGLIILSPPKAGLF